MVDQVTLDNICLSGGADGSDLQWAMMAGSLGHKVVHWSFQGHRSEAPSAAPRCSLAGISPHDSPEEPEQRS